MASKTKSVYKTGFCGSGFHEGTRPKSVSGVPIKVCSMIEVCTCKCHADITRMFEMGNRPRRVLDNPEYTLPISPYVMPTYEERIALHEAENARHARPVSLGKPLEVKAQQTFVETPTGIRARGQLEDQVLLVCSQFARGELEVEVLTPNFIAMEISEAEPPSVGAIGAVFDRWVRIGFARCEKKPVRFTSFTSEGMLKGLQYMKDKFKADAKKQAAGATAARLGMR